MRYLTLGEVLDLYYQVMHHTGGAVGVRDLNGLESAIAQPGMTFDGAELYPTIVENASALGFSSDMNHPFVDGNKRTGHAAMDVSGTEWLCHQASVEEQEKIILQLAAGELQRDVLTDWLRAHLSEKS